VTISDADENHRSSGK